jgi:hypothetical protein
MSPILGKKPIRASFRVGAFAEEVETNAGKIDVFVRIAATGIPTEIHHHITLS